MASHPYPPVSPLTGSAGGKQATHLHRTPKPPAHYSPFFEILGDVLGVICLFASLFAGLFLIAAFGG